MNDFFNPDFNRRIPIVLTVHLWVKQASDYVGKLTNISLIH